MTVLRWEETEEKVIAYVRPEVLFDLTTLLDRMRRPDGSSLLVARSKASGDFETYAFVYDRRRHRQLIEAEVQQMPELYLEQDRKDLARLRLIA